MIRETEVYEIWNGHGWLVDNNNKHQWKTRGEAIDVATEFKNNPRSHNESMTDDDVKYWKEKTYTVQKKITKVIELDVI